MLFTLAAVFVEYSASFQGRGWRDLKNVLAYYISLIRILTSSGGIMFAANLWNG